MLTFIKIIITYYYYNNYKKSKNYCSAGVVFIKFVDIIFCVILALVWPLRACHVINQESHVYSWNLMKIYLEIFWNFEISLVSIRRFQKVNSINFYTNLQISLLNMWLLVLIKSCKANACPSTLQKLRCSSRFYKLDLPDICIC